MTGQLATLVSFPVGCPRCHRSAGAYPMRVINKADPEGWAHRERRLVLECTNQHCQHTAVLEVHLIDVGIPTEAERSTERKRRARLREAS